MTDNPISEMPAKPTAKDRRTERLAAELRANLKRRKAAARGRDTAGTPPGDPKTPEKPET